MKRRRSRLALLGVLALAISVTVGLASGSLADAKKKKGGKPATAFVVQPGGAIPPGTTAPPFVPGVVKSAIPLTQKKFARVQSKQVRDVNVGLNIIDPAPGDVSDLSVDLIAPNGRTVSLLCGNVGGNAVAGLFLDDDTPVNTIFGGPDQGTSVDELNRPYTGVAEPCGLLGHLFSTPVRGVWTLRVRNFSGNPATLINWTLNVVSGPKFLSKGA